MSPAFALVIWRASDVLLPIARVVELGAILLMNRPALR